MPRTRSGLKLLMALFTSNTPLSGTFFHASMLRFSVSKFNKHLTSTVCAAVRSFLIQSILCVVCDFMQCYCRTAFFFLLSYVFEMCLKN